jgi:uncharacterized membrane protein YecN with MAPEG domain
MLMISPFYAALSALIFLWLSARVILYRRHHLISLGDNGDKSLLKRMRAQANCAEYTPIAALLLVLMEIGGADGWLLHLLGLMLVLGRALHGYGFSASPPKMQLRVLGMALTLAQIGCAALYLLLSTLL